MESAKKFELRLDAEIELPDGRPSTMAEFKTAHFLALEKLDPAQRAQVDKVIESFDEAHPGRSDFMAGRLENLGKLLDIGLLVSPDEAGETVLSQIATRLDAPLGGWTPQGRRSRRPHLSPDRPVEPRRPRANGLRFRL